MANLCVLYFQLAISDLHSKFAQGHIVDMQSARIGEEKELEGGPMPNVMAALPNIGGALC